MQFLAEIMFDFLQISNSSKYCRLKNVHERLFYKIFFISAIKP
eukprot:UN15532